MLVLLVGLIEVFLGGTLRSKYAGGFSGGRFVDFVSWCRSGGDPFAGRSAPPAGIFKLNVDATWNKSSGRFGLGIVVRQVRGDVVLAAALSFKGGTDMAVAEARAVLEGLVLAGSRGFCPLLAESNCLELVNLCNERESYLCDIDNVISDIRFTLGCFDVVSISHVPRAFNSVVHGIARWALSFSNFIN
ncbi:hypothetical protein ACOSQ3_010161 [Xanthoceras sorbifolium]